MNGDLVVFLNGDWVHIRCSRVMSTDEHVRDSRRLAARSRETLQASRQRVTGARETIDRMHCAVCRTLIGTAAWIRVDDQPVHESCASRA